MSLDVYLLGEKKEVTCTCKECWNDHTRIEQEEFYSANITHNLSAMADAAGIYEYLWRPDEIGITKAEQLIEPLTQGLKRLTEDPEKYKQYNSPNGWGMYENFVPFVRKYLEACIQHPEAEVYASR